MSILKQKWVFFNQILPHVPKQLTHLFHFGFWALTTERVTSMRGNARQIVANPHTAKTKAWRLLKNRKWTHVMPHVLVHLQLITSQSIVCLDFSDFHGWQILTFAIQTHQGRAIPVYFEMIKYPITEDSQNIFVVEAIERCLQSQRNQEKRSSDARLQASASASCIGQAHRHETALVFSHQ